MVIQILAESDGNYYKEKKTQLQQTLGNYVQLVEDCGQRFSKRLCDISQSYYGGKYDVKQHSTRSTRHVWPKKRSANRQQQEK